ncbi:MAG TPA: metallophosphoesterase [Acidimicrobiales bacterium]|nr:metallophosphoesterase [Acidimicrobiales bacterium]
MDFTVEPSPPPGRELYRFATVNDVHIGEESFGKPRRYREPDDLEPYPARCLRAALTEAKAWGAQRILGKGDLTDAGSEEEFEWFAAVVRDAGVEMTAILGNHDIRTEEVDGAAILGRRGIDMATEARALDVPGLRIVMLPSVLDYHVGQWNDTDRERVIALATDAEHPVFVATHHYPQRFSRANEFPPGISARNANPLLDALDRAAPRSIVACGHTHRHHRRHYKSLLITEIGSTKDFPGVWAGYRVYEGGITQTVHQIQEPSARAWLDRTGGVLFGAWRHWSPGVRSHRNWTWEWATPRR